MPALSERNPAQQPATRIMLIGASNLTFSFPLIINSLQNSLPGPLEIFAAHGHGRSFCEWSYVINRGLPPVLECGLWEEIAKHPQAGQTWALVTDVGNDLIYGRTVELVLGRVQETFLRLQATEAKITFVRMPLERILMLTERRYRIAKQLLFPGPTVPWNVISQQVIELDDLAASTAQLANAAVVTPRLDWYGIDPIHIRRSARIRAWKEILEAWPFESPLRMHWPTPRFSLNLWRSPPLERTYGCRRYIASQPSWKAADGTAIWLY